MAATHGEGEYGNGVGVTTPLEHRIAQLSDFVRTGPTTIRTGVLWDGNATIVTGRANMAYDVRAFTIATQRSSSQGVVKWGNDATVTVSTTAAPGSNSRYDSVIAFHRDFAAGDANSDPLLTVVQGTAAASPTPPSLAAYPGAIELARILVPAGVTATNSGTTITQTAPFTASAGGIIPFRNTTERDAGTYLEGQLGWLIDSNQTQVYDGTTWPSIGSQIVVPSAATNGSVTANGVVTSTAQTLVRIRDAFPSGYRVFRVTYDVTMSVSTLVFKLASGATDASTAYDYQRTTEISTTVATVQDLNQSFGSLSAIPVAGARHVGEFLLTDPNFAGPTYYNGYATVAPPAAMTASTGATRVAGLHRTATAYDSLTMLPASGNITVNRLTVTGVS